MLNKSIDPNRKPDDFIDDQGYWIDPERNVRRPSGDQEIILRATGHCTKAEWLLMIEEMSLGAAPN